MPDSEFKAWQAKKILEDRHVSVMNGIEDKEVAGLIDEIDIDDINNILLFEVKKSGSNVGSDATISRQNFLLRVEEAEKNLKAGKVKKISIDKFIEAI